MGSSTWRKFLIRPGALGDALLTVPLLTRLATSDPDFECLWYQSPWTIELPWARILPPECAGVQIRNFEAPEIAALFSDDSENVDNQVGGMAMSHVIDVGVRRHPVLEESGYIFCAYYHWIPAPVAATQEAPHAAERLCQEQFAPGAAASLDPQAPVVFSVALPLAGEGVDLQRAWLVNPVPVFRRDERICLIHPGAGSRAKQRPLETWVALAAQRREAGMRVRYLLGPAELERGMRPQLDGLDIRGEIVTPVLRDLPEVVGAAGEFWGHDSGPSHLAGMMGLPTHVFFGPTNPDVWRPLGPKVSVYRFG